MRSEINGAVKGGWGLKMYQAKCGENQVLWEGVGVQKSNLLRIA